MEPQTTQPMQSRGLMHDLDERKTLCNEVCNEVREELLISEQKIRELVNKILYFKNTLSEEYQQAVIALRDCESSRMRLGKVIQYLSDGVSIYDKK